ncbi:MAG: ATP-binding protein [Ignavibacteria bacterium]|nr:ATP-binding protein [Ignavibacteria bacterium]
MIKDNLYPNLIVLNLPEFDLQPIIKELNFPIEIVNCYASNFYNCLLTHPNSIVIASGEDLIEFINNISDPNKLSKEQLKQVLLICKEIETYQSILDALPDTEIFVVPFLKDLTKVNRTIKNLLEKIYSSLTEDKLKKEISELRIQIQKLNEENRTILTEIEKYISDLEIRSLELEVLNKKLKEEIGLREAYQNELSKVNNILQEYANRLNEVINELKTFNHTVSHDLKAPLRGIMGYVKELVNEHFKDMKLSERASFCLNQINKAAQNMTLMIDDLLKYSKLEFETPTLIESDLEEIINSVLNEYEITIREKNATIQLNLEVKKIISWQRGLQQIFTNLIGNALKYSKQNECPKITISSKQLDKNLLIIVEDNGIGFDMIYTEKIFQLFKRATTDEKYGGTGVGLAIVKKLTEKLKGKIWAQSEPGVGSKFFLEIPLMREVNNGGSS